MKLRNPPIHHHYIPELILRNFTDEKGVLNCVYKSSGRVFRSSPSGVFAENHLHTQRDAFGNKDMSVETKLAVSIERPVVPVVEKIVQKARIGQTPGLAVSEKRAWDNFFCCQLTRLPSARRSLSDGEIVSQHLRMFEEEKRPLTSSERATYEDPALQREIVHNAWVEILPESEGELMEVLRSKGLVIGVIKNPKKSFVIGDNPTVRIEPLGRSHLRFPEVEILFPISHDVMVTPGHLAGEENIVDLVETKWIRKVNETIFQQSSIIAGRSQRLIESLGATIRR